MRFIPQEPVPKVPVATRARAARDVFSGRVVSKEELVPPEFTSSGCVFS
jgi:hypothetical protein